MNSIKRSVIDSRLKGTPAFATNARDVPVFQTEFEKAEKQKKKKEPHLGFQPLEKKKESHDSDKQKGEGIRKTEEEEDRKKKKKAWETPDLDDDKQTLDLPGVIKSIKDENVVWDHGETKLGRKSDRNFFIWFEAYSLHQYKRKQQSDDSIFDIVQ